MLSCKGGRMEKLYEFINQYDRAVYIEGESTEAIKVKTATPWNTITALENIETYTAVNNSLLLNKEIKSSLFKIIEDVPILSIDTREYDSRDIEISSYESRYHYIVVSDSLTYGSISVADTIGITETGTYLLRFNNTKHFSADIKVKKCLAFSDYTGSTLITKESLSMGDTLIGLVDSMSIHSRYSKNISFISNNLNSISLSDTSTFNSSQIPNNVIIVDYKTNSIYTNAFDNDSIYFTELTTAYAIKNTFRIRTTSANLEELMLSKYPTINISHCLFVCDGNILPFGLKFFDDSRDRRITIYEIDNAYTFSMEIKTFKTPNSPSDIMLSKLNILDIDTYSPISDDTFSSYSESSSFIKQRKKTKKSFEVELKDSDENREIITILKSRYKIIEKRCDQYVLQ